MNQRPAKRGRPSKIIKNEILTLNSISNDSSNEKLSMEVEFKEFQNTVNNYMSNSESKVENMLTNLNNALIQSNNQLANLIKSLIPNKNESNSNNNTSSVKNGVNEKFFSKNISSDIKNNKDFHLSDIKIELDDSCLKNIPSKLPIKPFNLKNHKYWVSYANSFLSRYNANFLTQRRPQTSLEILLDKLLFSCFENSIDKYHLCYIDRTEPNVYDLFLNIKNYIEAKVYESRAENLLKLNNLYYDGDNFNLHCTLFYAIYEDLKIAYEKDLSEIMIIDIFGNSLRKNWYVFDQVFNYIKTEKKIKPNLTLTEIMDFAKTKDAFSKS